MADTSSIASRMEKLAKLKRMKLGLSGDSDAGSASEAPEPAIAIPLPSDSFETEYNASTKADATEPDLGFGIEDALGLSREEATGAPSLGGVDDDADFTGGPADELGDIDFASAEAVDANDDLGIPGDLHDAPAKDRQITNDEPESLESYFDSMGVSDEQTAGEQPNDSRESSMTASELDIDADTMGALDELAALAGVQAADRRAPETPDFTMTDVEPETLEREFEHEQATAETNSKPDTDGDAVTANDDGEGRIAVTFDESRTTLLNHVSRQMNCSVEDVVVTALDWYLDALFGEDEEAKAG